MSGELVPAPRAGLAKIERASVGEVLAQIWRTFEPATREAYQSDWRAFAAFSALDAIPVEDLPDALRQVEPEHVARWKDHLLETSSPATAGRRLAGVRAFFSALVEAEWLTRNPAKGRRFSVRARRRNPARSGPSVENYATLLEYLEERATTERGVRNFAIFALLAWGPARVSDVTGMTMGDWRDSRETAGGERVVLLSCRKGHAGEDRPLTVPPAAVAWVDRYLELRDAHDDADNDPVFLGRSGGIGRNAVGAMIRTAAKACGFKCWPHALRHLFATVARDRGATLEEVADALGHSDTRTAKLYDDAIRASRAYTHLADLMRPPRTEEGS